MSDQKLKLYGADWCLKSSNIRNYLQSIWVEFDDFNVETNKDAEKAVRDLYNGELKFPTVVYGTDFLKNPSLSELDKFLEKYGLREL
ncbi:glutaredoxin family protein [Fulvivirga sp. M361]|uniref:glutaredoxin family protein n=1 Tax=Fulvivirga sp. M361 TaxID=2594266 RepID=UPI00117B274E|nr:glutaredoxin domain-containing protein [Fulvivirga sp. M361]TRX58277.1 glutaredoxin family protein [Fulvivirga sp. M361]